jgi:hypothetical protein
MSSLTDQLEQDHLSVEKVVPGDSLHAVERKRMLVHTITSAVDEILRQPGADSSGMMVTVHTQKPLDEDDDDHLIVTVTTPQFVLARH